MFVFGFPIHTFKNIINNFWELSINDGKGSGTPLQYSCLENPMDGGAWWAAVYGVAQSRTRLKRLSSSSSSHVQISEYALTMSTWQPLYIFKLVISLHSMQESIPLWSCVTWLLPTPSTLALSPEKSHGQRSLVGCLLWGRTESDTTEAT